MHVVDDIAVLLGKPLDHDVITSVVGVKGRELPDDHDPGHPEDKRHYYIVPSRGLQFLAGPDRVIRTALFMLRGDEHVSAYPWRTASGVGPGSTRRDVRMRLGEPEASGKGFQLVATLPPYGPWDRFPFPPFGFLRVQYDVSGDGVTDLALMDETAVPRGR